MLLLIQNLAFCVHWVHLTVFNLTYECTVQWVSASRCFIHPRSSLAQLSSSCLLHFLLLKEREERQTSDILWTNSEIRTIQATKDRGTFSEFVLWNCNHPLARPLQLSLCKTVSICSIVLHAQNLQNLVMSCPELSYGYYISLRWHLQYGNYRVEMFLAPLSNKSVFLV